MHLSRYSPLPSWIREWIVSPPLMLGLGSGPRYSPRATGGARRATDDGVLRSLFERSSDPMVVLDENHVIVDANEAATRFLDCPVEALRGAPVLDVDPLAHILTTGGTLGRVRTEPSPVIDDVDTTNAEGQPIQCRVEAIAAEGGRTLLHLHDNTALLRARSALRTAVHLHQAWFEAMPSVAWTMALPEERLLEISPAVEVLFGHQPAEFRTQQTLWEELVHPAERERVRAEFRKGVATARPFEITFTGMHRDHRDLPHLVNHVIPVADERGWVEHCEGFIEDRSALKALQNTHVREESQLRHVLQAVPAGVMVVEDHLGGAVALCSPRMAQLLRLPEPPAPGTPLSSLPEEARRIAGGTQVGATRPAEGPLEEVFELQAPHRVLRRSMVAIRDPFGRVTGWVVALEDITTPWITRRRFVHAQKMESLTRLASGIAHDFNNLLGTIAGFASLVADRTPEDDPRRAAIDGVLAHAERATRLTQALQSFGRTARFERVELDINRVIDAAYPLLRSGLDTGVTVEVELASALPRVPGDPVLLQQLVVQLVQDAGLMLCAGDSIRIATRTTPRDTETGGSIEIEVSRTCAGDGGTRTGRDEDGAFARAAIDDIVRAHGGRLITGAAAAPATHRVVLPARNVVPIAHIHQDEGQVESGGTILIVEDEADLLSVTRMGLEQRGYVVSAATSGERALEKLNDPDFTCSLVLLDLRLPGMPGEQVLGTIRGIRPDLPVVIVTGDGQGSRESWAAAGASGFLAKPYGLRELAGVVREVLEAKRRVA